MKKLLGIVVLGLLWCSTGFSDISDKDLELKEKILKYITTPTGEVTKEVHDYFWMGIDKKLTVKQLNDAEKKDGSVPENLSLMISIIFRETQIKVEKELWESVLVSYETMSIFKTRNFVEAKEKFDLTNNANLSSDKQKMLLRNKMFDEFINRILVAASKNDTSFLDMNLERTDLTRNYILNKKVQSLILLDRFNKLNNPNYFTKN
jgi:hypothetical protein